MDGAEAKRFTSSDANDTSARWASDGKSIFFLSTRGGSSQVWRMPIDGGEAQQITHVALDVDNLVVSPDGKRLLFTLEVYPDLPPDKEIAETAARDAKKEASKVKAKVYESLFVRHWDTWEDGKRSHVFAWTIGEGEPRDLMPAFDGDAPTKPFGGSEEIAISPDGKEVVFACQLATRDIAWSTNVDLWSVPLDANTGAGSAAPKCLTSDNKATAYVQTLFHHTFANLLSIQAVPGGWITVPMSQIPSATSVALVTTLTTNIGVTNFPWAPNPATSKPCRCAWPK